MYVRMYVGIYGMYETKTKLKKIQINQIYLLVQETGA